VSNPLGKVAARVSDQTESSAWERLWWEQLYGAEVRAAERLKELLVPMKPAADSDRSDASGAVRENRQVGILPAVYFPQLRLGSVLFESWKPGSRAVQIGFPWNPGELPPPFGCYVPRLDIEGGTPLSSGKLDVRLISRVAEIVDHPPSCEEDAKGERFRLFQLPHMKVWCGISSWQSAAGTGESGFILDADYLENADVAATTVIYVFPSLDLSTVQFVPLFYFQSNTNYHLEQTADELQKALIAGDTDPADAQNGADRTLWRAVSAVAQLARLRAETWINKKTGLLSQQGLEAIRQDLQYRALQGHSFAEVFFDLDHFKTMNDRLSYERADDIARAVADVVTAYAHTWLDEEYRIWLTQTELGARTAGLTAPIDPLRLWRPDAFRALFAHVSGDEFKLYIRTDDTIATRQPPPVDAAAKDVAEGAALRDFVGGLIASVRALAAGTADITIRDLFPPGSSSVGVHETIHARMILKSTAFRKRLTTILKVRLKSFDVELDEVLRHVSISVGIARLRVLRDMIDRRADIPLDETELGSLGTLIQGLAGKSEVPSAAVAEEATAARSTTVNISGLLALRKLVEWVGNRISEEAPHERFPTFQAGEDVRVLNDVLHDLDIRAERALDGAKKRGRDRMMTFGNLLRSGGAVLDVRGDQVRISLGEQDFVRECDELDVFAQSIRRIDAEGVQSAREARRFYRDTPPWIARVKVHKVWPRESMAHVISGNAASIEPEFWLRWDGEERDFQLVIVVQPTAQLTPQPSDGAGPA
jgi:hypothetical protein